MAGSDDLRAKAKQLYDQAQSIRNPDERLGVVLKAMEFEVNAEVLEIGQGMMPRRTTH